jgi:predicted transcriptional regulator
MNPEQIIEFVNIPLAVATLILTVLSIFQFFQKQSEVKTREFLLTDWHNTMEGLRNALFQIAQNPNRFSTKDDVVGSVNILAQIVSSMTQAMEEQRFFSTKQTLQNRQEKQV